MTAANIELARKAIVDIAGEGRLDLIDDIIAPDFIRHDLGGGPDVAGPENVKRFVSALRAAFPDVAFTIDDLVAQDDKVVARYTAEGTHQGPFQRIEPTGKRVRWQGINVYRCAEGKLVETWQLMDTFGLMRQLRSDA